MITYQQAVTLGKKLKAVCPAILGVELFGSTAINGQGRDADFLILVDDALAKRWWSDERESIRVRWPDALYGQRWIVKKFIPFIYSATIHNRKKKRMKVAADMLNFKLEDLADAQGIVPDFEMFLMPALWRTNKEVNTDVMAQATNLVSDRNTAGFLRRIAKDAVSITEVPH